MKIIAKSLFLLAALCFGLLTVLAPLASAQNLMPLWTNYSGVYPQNSTTDYGNHPLTTDIHGNVIVAGYTGSGPAADYLTVKISSSGVSLWTNRFSTGNNQDVAFAAVTDGDNVFVTGTANADYGTIKYSASGTPQWTNRYDGGSDGAVGMAVDISGNVIVTGSSRPAGGNLEWATVKYSNSGALQWVRRYGDPGSSDALAVSVAVDTTNVYVFGYNINGEFATVAYSSVSGTPLWTNHYGSGNSRPQEVVADNNGHVFVTGSAAKTTPPFDEDFVTLAYSSAGVPLWTNLYGASGLPDSNDRPIGLAVSRGNVFVLGSAGWTDQYLHFATVAYSTAGAALWTNRFSGDWGEDFPQAIAADSTGNVFVTGRRGDGALNTHYGVTLAYSGAGTLLWTNEIRYDVISPTEIAVDSAGNVFVTGYSGSGGGVTLKYSSSLPVLRFQWFNNQLVISWTNPGCALQSSTNIAGPYVDIGGATSPYTNSASGSQQFFRLNCN